MKLSTPLFHLIFLFFFAKKSTCPSSGEASFLEVANVNLPNKPPLTIEKSPDDPNQVNIVSDDWADDSEIIAKFWILNESASLVKFEDTRFLSIETEESLDSVTFSVSSESCVFPFVFSSKTFPTFSIYRNAVKLNLDLETSDFDSLYTQTKEFSVVEYTKPTEKVLKKSKVFVFCPFYLQVGNRDIFNK